MTFWFTKNFPPKMEKKNSIAKYFICVTAMQLEFFLVIFPWCIPLVKFFLIKLPLVCSPPGKLSTSHPGFFWSHQHASRVLLVLLPPGESPQIFFHLIFFYKTKFYSKRNYLFYCHHEHINVVLTFRNILICQHFFDFLSNTRYQKILSMKPSESNLQDRRLWGIGLYSLLYSVRKVTCPRDWDSVLKMSCLLHLSFTSNKS